MVMQRGNAGVVIQDSGKQGRFRVINQMAGYSGRIIINNCL